MRSSDVDHDMDDIAPIDAYGAFAKASPNDGALAIRGLGDANAGVIVNGYAMTENTTTGTGAQAPVWLIARKTDTTGGATGLGSTANAVVFANDSQAKWIMKATGVVHLDIAHSGSYFDEYDDVSLVRAMSNSGGLGYIESKWDEFVTHSKEDLVDLDIISADGKFVNQQGIMKLQNGAIWQLHERIAELEAKLDGIH